MDFEEIAANHLHVGDDISYPTGIWTITAIKLNKAPLAKRYELGLILKVPTQRSGPVGMSSVSFFALGEKAKRRVARGR